MNEYSLFNAIIFFVVVLKAFHTNIFVVYNIWHVSIAI